MEKNPENVCQYIESLLDRGRLGPGLSETAQWVRARLKEADKATDSETSLLPADWYRSLYEIRFEQVRKSGSSHWGFQETIDCLKNDVAPEAQVRLLSLYNDKIAFIFFVEVEAHRLVGIMLAEVNEGVTEDYREFLRRELVPKDLAANTWMHDFDYLRIWHRWSDAKLRSLYSDEVQAWLCRMQEALGSEEERTVDVNIDNLPEVVRTLQKRASIGSKMLGLAITESAGLAKNGRLDEARSVFGQFLEDCPSAFYRQIAKGRLQALSSKP